MALKSLKNVLNLLAANLQEPCYEFIKLFLLKSRSIMLVGCGWNIECNSVVVMIQPLNRALWPHGSEGLSPY